MYSLIVNLNLKCFLNKKKKLSSQHVHISKRKWCTDSLLIADDGTQHWKSQKRDEPGAVTITPTVLRYSKTFLSWNNSSGLLWKNASHTWTGSVLFCQEPTVLWLITPQRLKDDFCVKKTPFSDDSSLVANGELQYIKKDGRWWERHCWATQLNLWRQWT